VSLFCIISYKLFSLYNILFIFSVSVSIFSSKGDLHGRMVVVKILNEHQWKSKKKKKRIDFYMAEKRNRVQVGTENVNCMVCTPYHFH